MDGPSVKERIPSLIYAKNKIIILQTIRHLESHLIIKGLDPKGDVHSFFARSALKSQKRFAGGVLEMGNYIQVDSRLSRSSEGLQQLQSASLINGFKGIRTHYDRMQLCFYILKVVNQVSQTGISSEPEFFHLLGNTLKALETTMNLHQLKLFFEIRFLYIQGILPFELQSKGVFFKHSIAHHNQVDLSKEDIPFIQIQVKEALSQYLS